MKKKSGAGAFAIVKVACKHFDKIEPYIVLDWKKQKSWNHQISFKERFAKLKIFFYSFLFRILQTFRKKIALIKYGTFTAPLEVIKVCKIVKTSVDFRCQIHQHVYAKLLHAQIPKLQKDWQLDCILLHFWICVC